MGEVFKLNHCYNVDCLPAMELFPDNYFDLAVVDPPYFSGPERRGFYGSKVSKIGVHRDYPVSPAWSKPEPEYSGSCFECAATILYGAATILTTSLLPDGSCGTSAMEILAFQIARLRRQICFPQ